jgi:hypothetical protein
MIGWLLRLSYACAVHLSAWGWGACMARPHHVLGTLVGCCGACVSSFAVAPPVALLVHAGQALLPHLDEVRVQRMRVCCFEGGCAASCGSSSMFGSGFLACAGCLWWCGAALWLMLWQLTVL